MPKPLIDSAVKNLVNIELEMASIYVDYISNRGLDEHVDLSNLEKSMVNREQEIFNRYAIKKIEGCINPNALHDCLKATINDKSGTVNEIDFYHLLYSILSISSDETLSALLGVIKYADVESNVSYNYHNITKTAIIEKMKFASQNDTMESEDCSAESPAKDYLPLPYLIAKLPIPEIEMLRLADISMQLYAYGHFLEEDFNDMAVSSPSYCEADLIKLLKSFPKAESIRNKFYYDQNYRREVDITTYPECKSNKVEEKLTENPTPVEGEPSVYDAYYSYAKGAVEYLGHMIGIID